MDAAPEEFDTLKEIADQLMNIATNEDIDEITNKVLTI